MDSPGIILAVHLDRLCHDPTYKDSGYNGQSSFGAGDTTYMTLAPVQGDYPLVFDAIVDSISCDLELYQGQPFNELPEVKIIANDTVITYSTIATVTGYTLDITDSLSVSGILRLSTVDAGNNPYSIDLGYAVASDTGGNFTKVIGPQGGVVVSLDPNAIQAGQTQSVSTHPVMSFMGINVSAWLIITTPITYGITRKK